MLWMNPNDHLLWIPMRKMPQIENFMPEKMNGVFKQDTFFNHTKQQQQQNKWNNSINTTLYIQNNNNNKNNQKQQQLINKFFFIKYCKFKQKIIMNWTKKKKLKFFANNQTTKIQKINSFIPFRKKQ